MLFAVLGILVLLVDAGALIEAALGLQAC